MNTSPAWTAEAPGRLDVMGGVADYSGSLVLEMPIRAHTRVTITTDHTPTLRLTSASEGETSASLDELHPLLGNSIDTKAIRTWLVEHGVPHWAHYSVGSFLLFCRAVQWWPRSGLSFHIESDVPPSMGVSSSAALEVATLRALEKMSGHQLPGTTLARMAQQAENEIVGAPCGLMDQLASAHGIQSTLLPILCRPDILDEPVSLPQGIVAVGWPSGVKHAVTASPYANARAASFMAKKILEDALGQKLEHITELTPSIVRAVSEEVLPPRLQGSEFLSRYGNVDDALSTIEPKTIYAVRAGATFPVEENWRAQIAVHLLRGATQDSRQAVLNLIGELMFQAHEGYNSIGLGTAETDKMVQAIRKLGPQRGFYGARVSGGGSGGTVVVLLEEIALPALKTLSQSMFFSADGPLPLIM